MLEAPQYIKASPDSCFGSLVVNFRSVCPRSPYVQCWLPDIAKVILRECLKEYLICGCCVPNCSPLYLYASSYSLPPKYITAIQNASCGLWCYILCLCICFFGPHGVLKKMDRLDSSSCQRKKWMISLLKTGKVLMFFIKAEIIFFLLLMKWRGHNCKPSEARSLVMLTASLFRHSSSHENFICFNSRGKPTKRNKTNSCFSTFLQS